MTEPIVNLVPARYRNVSVASVPVSLAEDSLRAHFAGRPAYRQTRYIVAQRIGATGAGKPAAVVEVTKRSAAPLFSEITAVSMVAHPGETAFVEAPAADTGIPTILGRIAAERAPGARCVIVRGRYGHVGFIADPAPVRIRVIEVVPPRPAKLVDQASRVLELAEDLPPVELAPELTDLAALAGSSPAAHYLFPCRAGAEADDAGTADAGRGDAAVSYLDEIPPQADWTLVGCARSRAIHDWFYAGEAPVVDICPRNLARSAAAQRAGPVLTKCCLLEDKILVEDGLVVVPWGASLDQVREGLARAVETVPAGRRVPP
jgi:hypothetical protein